MSKALGRPWGGWQSGSHWVPPLGPVSDLFHVPTVAGGWCLAQNNPEVLTTGPRNLGDPAMEGHPQLPHGGGVGVAGSVEALVELRWRKKSMPQN